MQFTDWQTVALISRLTILNRVAFTMLFFVPLLSGFLKPVRQSVDKANAAIDTVQDKTQNVRDIARGGRALAEVTAELRGKLVDVASDGDDPIEVQFVAAQQSQALDNWFEWNINKPFLPRPWALAFIAALLILGADTVFQIWCPQRVKREPIEDYVTRQCSEYANQPSRHMLEVSRHAAQEGSPELFALEKSLASEVKGADEGTRELLLEDLRQVRINFIEIASRKDYLRWSRENSLASGLCCLLYLAAACFVTKILQEQTFNVLNSAGWWTS